MNLTHIKKSAIILAAYGLLILFGCGPDKETKYADLIKKYDEYFAAGKFEEARLSIQSAIDIRPQEGDAYYKLGEVLLRQEKFPNAVENYRSAVNYNKDHRDARYRLATIMLAAKDYEASEDNAEKILAQNPKDVDALILKANIAAASTRKDYVLARQLLEGVLKEHPKNANAIASLGTLALQQDELKEAEERFTEALALDPKSLPLRLVLADLFARQGRLDESQQQLESVVKDDPKNSGIRFGLAEFLLKRGLGDKAENQYEESLKVDALRHDARDRLYDIYLSRRDSEKAKGLTAALEKSHPENPGTLYFRGRDLELDGKFPQALEEYLKSIKGQTTFAAAFRRAGFIQLGLGDEQNGLDNLNKAITIDPGDIPARLELANRALLGRKLAEAGEQVNQVLARFPRHLAAHILRADIAMLEGRTDEARKVYDFLIENFPKSPQGIAKLAVLEERDNHIDKAIELYRKSLTFDVGVLGPGQRLAKLLAAKSGIKVAKEEFVQLEAKSQNSKPEYQYLLASLILADPSDPERIKTAKGYLEKAIEAKPELSAAYLALANLDALQGNREAAITNYEKVAASNPKHVPSRILLATLREQQGKVDEAAVLYREVLSIDPRVGIAANNLAWLLSEKKGGNLDEALKYAEIGKERMPQVGDAADTLGWIHFKRGSYRAALPFIQEAISLNEKSDNKQSNPIIYYHLAEVHFALNDMAAAKAAAGKALEGVGDKHPAYARLQEIIQNAS